MKSVTHSNLIGVSFACDVHITIVATAQVICRELPQR